MIKTNIINISQDTINKVMEAFNSFKQNLQHFKHSVSVVTKYNVSSV